MNRVLKKEKTENKTSVRYFEGLNLWIFAAVLVANVFFQLSEVSSSLFLYVGTFILLGTIFIIDRDEYAYLFVSLISVLRFSMIFDVSVINIITIVYFVQTYMLDNEYKKESQKQRLPQFLVIAGVIHIMLSARLLFQGIEGIQLTLSAVKLLLFLIFIVDIFRNMKDKQTAEKTFMNIQVYYVAGVLIAVFTSILVNPAYSLDATRMSLSENGGVNQLAITLTSCLCFVSLGMTKVTNIKEWAVLAATALPLLYFCFATQSRTSIIGMIIIFGAVMIFGYAQKRARLWITLMCIASVLVFGGMILLAEGTQLHENIMGTIERFINPRDGDVTSGRVDLWKMYIDILKNDTMLFFFGGTIDKYNNILAHNMLLEMLAGFGLVGTVAIAGVYVAAFYEIRQSLVSLRKGKIRILGFLPFLMVFVVGIASHSLINTEPTINFCLGAAMIYLYGEDVSDENNVADCDDTGYGTYRNRKRYKNIRRLDRRYSKKFRRI